ncbi:MAG: amidohydrolase [Synergistaceae bacterium]|jgi:amidohydrolase|nr:amidohydrolase [Synergistaceae bacterium]
MKNDMENDMEKQVKDAVKKHYETAVLLSEDLAAHPELSHQEFESSRKIVDLLEKSGFKVEYPFQSYATAFSAILDNGPGADVAILVEYDALPEIGHGCGHNLHGSLSVLAGLALMELKDLFGGKIHVIGTPGEEADGAKVGMAENGVFDKMAVAMMAHSCGGGVCQPDMDALSLRCLDVTFLGRGAHAAAAPWKGHSALAAARKFLDLIDARRECFTPDIRVNGIILDGGKAPNIIPERSELRIEFRTDSLMKLKRVDEMVVKCANGAAMALDCQVELKRTYADFADMVRVTALEDEVTKILTGMGKKVSVVSSPIGSTDVGNVSYCCPSIQPLVSITDEPLALHTVEFANATLKPPARDALSFGAEALVLLTLKVLREETFRHEIHDEFVRRRAEKTGEQK